MEEENRGFGQRDQKKSLNPERNRRRKPGEKTGSSYPLRGLTETHDPVNLKFSLTWWDKENLA